MYDYYCDNCDNIVGKWNNYYNYYKVMDYCNFIKSKNFNKTSFLDCKKCNKFVGILCYDVCENCFGYNLIFGEENLFKWFLKYKKIKPDYLYNYCKKCNKKIFRCQYWFFEELTFINIIN